MVLVVLAFFGFVSLGLPDAANGVAWPLIRERFELSQASLAALFVSVTIGQVISANVASTLARKLGLGRLLAVSTLLVGVALGVYARAPSWPIFVAAAPLIGLGSGAIDTAINAYAAHKFSARVMNWLHACYGVGAAIGPLIMTASVIRGSYANGYSVLAVCMTVMAVAFILSARMWPSAAAGGHGTSKLAALRQPGVLLQIVVFFVYTGFESAAAQWIFVLLNEGLKVHAKLAGTVASGYWWSLMAGRILLGAVVDRVGADKLLRVCVGASLAGAVLTCSGNPLVCIGGLLVVGFALAPIYPTLTSRTPDRFGAELTGHIIGFQVAISLAGVAALPSLTGVIAQSFGPRAIGPTLAVFAVVLVVVHELLIRRTAVSRN